ncbi:MAG: hypothetical protein ACYSWR_01060 [Planctomycetota bacterium]
MSLTSSSRPTGVRRTFYSIIAVASSNAKLACGYWTGMSNPQPSKLDNYTNPELKSI